LKALIFKRYGKSPEVDSRVTRSKPGDAVFANIFDVGTGAIAESRWYRRA
jgi:hypothetical protein